MQNGTVHDKSLLSAYYEATLLKVNSLNASSDELQAMAKRSKDMIAQTREMIAFASRISGRPIAENGASAENS